MRKTIITVLSTLTVAVGALGAAGVATAAPVHALTGPSPIVALCEAMPAFRSGLATELDTATKSLATATSTLSSRRAVMTTAIRTYANSIIVYMNTVEAKGDTATAAYVLKAHQTQFVDSVLGWNSARLAAFEGDGNLNLVQLRSTFVGALEGAGCMPRGA